MRLVIFTDRRVASRALVALALVARSAQAQQVRLRVTSDTMDTPVPKALVVSLNDREVWQTDDDGMLYVRTAHPGANVFTVRHIGLAPLTVTVDVPEHGTRAMHLIMTPAAQVLDTVDVNAHATTPQLSVFDDRRLHNVGGHFITWADIQRRHPRETIDLFQQVLGLEVVTPPIGDPVIESTRGGLGAPAALCFPSIGLDGLVLAKGPTGQPFSVNLISPEAIYGIEIYSGGATIPGEYLGSMAATSCGLIMIWTLGGPHQVLKPPT